ncbi:MAG: FkbM family methyltransferase [Pseudomonadota bacterium]
MRIIIDLQSAQGISRNRGIARYSLELSKALIRQASMHEFYLLLNANCSNTIESVRNIFKNLIPQKQIKVFETPKKISGHDHKNYWRIQASEKIREHFLDSLAPDIVYISSPFEGWIDDAPISIGHLNHNYLTVSTLYDLIPFIYPDFYIKNSGAPHFFVKKMQFLKQLDFLLTISDSTSREAIELLSFPSDRIANCSVGVDNKFMSCAKSGEKLHELREYGIKREFIFYIGGFDFRKNVRSLVEAFSLLPAELRKKYQLVIIVTSAESTIAHFAYAFCTHFKLSSDEVIFINYVPEDKLIILYSLCSLFVFPSLHEGFGLPIIEAMACGAPVISSNVSSMPEATGCPEALFDPKTPQTIAKKITEVLTNKDFQNFLKEHGEKHAKKFTWENTAKKALQVLERLYETKTTLKKTQPSYHKKKLAYISPLPAEKTGISDYSAQVIPELACFYEIILITNQTTIEDDWLKANFPIKNVTWFINHADLFDIVLYQFGNSYFHHYMLDLLNVYPGIVVLHDFFLSGLFHWVDVSLPSKKHIFYRALYDSHGFSGLAHHQIKGRAETMKLYPCNISVLKRALGIITHSKHAISLAEKWYGPLIAPRCIAVSPPHLAQTILNSDQKKARTNLGFSQNDFLICSFGYLHPNKLNHRLISACLTSLLINKNNLHLIFIGERYSGDYDEKLLNLITLNNLQKRVHFANFVKEDFMKNYLLATDIAVQLRTDSRGETSASILNCLSHGIPTIANNHGSIREISDQAMLKLNDKFTDEELSKAIHNLYKNINLCKKLSANALDYIRKYHHPAETGKQYYNAIEYSYQNNENFKEKHLIQNLSKNIIQQPNEEDLLAVANAISANRSAIGSPRLLIDISVLKESINHTNEVHINLLLELITSSIPDLRIEAIYYNVINDQYYHATDFFAQRLHFSEKTLQDTPLEISPKDMLLIFNLSSKTIMQSTLNIENWHAKGIKVYFLFSIENMNEKIIFSKPQNLEIQTNLKKLATLADGFVGLEKEVLPMLRLWLNSISIKRSNPPKIGCLDIKNNKEILSGLLKLLIKQQWSTKWKEHTPALDPYLSQLKIINRKIQIVNNEYYIEGEERYLDYAGNPFDPSLVSIFNIFCKDDYQVLDLGANIGLTAIALANICKKGKIIAIEPMSYTFNLLKNNIKNSRIKNIFAHNFGVGNKECQVMMQSHGDFLAGAFIVDSYQQANKKCISSKEVPIKPLDSIFEKLEIERVDFIKMDLEGYELFALEGAKKLLKQFKPIVYLEMNHWCLNIFYRITLAEFKERLSAIFPYIFAIEPTRQDFYLDFNATDNFLYIAHEHLIKFKYCNIIAGFDKNELLKKFNSVTLKNKVSA